MLGDVLGVVVALLLVLALAWLVLRFLARMQTRSRGGGPAPLRYLRAMPVGSRERVVVVAYHGEELLLGVTAGGIVLLDRRPLSPEPERPEAGAANLPALPPKVRAWAARLRRRGNRS